MISTGPRNQSVLSGSKVSLDCVGEGVPAPFVMWTSGRESRPVYQEEGVTVSTNGSLIFESVASSHNGNYTCWAVSSGGASQRHAQLVVTDKKGYHHPCARDRLRRCTIRESKKIMRVDRACVRVSFFADWATSKYIRVPFLAIRAAVLPSQQKWSANARSIDRRS